MPNEKAVLSTRDLPESDRVEIWRDAMARSAFPVDVEPLPGREVEGQAALSTLGNLMISKGTASGTAYKSVTGNQASDAVLVVLHGPNKAVYNRKNREIHFRSGQTAIVTSATAYEVKIPSGRFVSVCMPRRMLEPLVADVDAAALRPVGRDQDAAQLLWRYLRIVGEHPSGSAAGQLAADHVRDLAALVVGATRDGREQATGRGLAAVRLAALKADCVAHFDRPDFNIGQLAVRAGLSPRSVRALFESDGTTFTDVVRSARLERARRLLADPQFEGRRVAEIAFECGFSDLSYFNRCFRQRYGLTPSEFRVSVRAPSWRR